MTSRGAQGYIAETDLLVFHPSSIHGLGAFAKGTIPKQTRVIEYTGQKIPKSESLRRCAQHNEFIFTLSPDQDLDGNTPANLARFINHSCAPNCEAELDEERIWIVALHDILTGEEITINYGFDLEDYRQYPCQCGSAACVGYIVAQEFFEHVRGANLVRSACNHAVLGS